MHRYAANTSGSYYCAQVDVGFLFCTLGLGVAKGWYAEHKLNLVAIHGIFISNDYDDSRQLNQILALYFVLVHTA